MYLCCPRDLVVFVVFVLRRVDDVLPALEGQLVAQLNPSVATLDQGLDLVNIKE